MSGVTLDADTFKVLMGCAMDSARISTTRVPPDLAANTLAAAKAAWKASTEPALEFEFASEVIAEPNSKPDAPPNFVVHTLCPHCQDIDTVILRDVAIRWNTLSLEFADTETDYQDGITVIGSVGEGQKDFSDDGYFCLACRIELVRPDYFDVNWS